MQRTVSHLLTLLNCGRNNTGIHYSGADAHVSRDRTATVEAAMSKPARLRFDNTEEILSEATRA